MSAWWLLLIIPAAGLVGAGVAYVLFVLAFVSGFRR